MIYLYSRQSASGLFISVSDSSISTFGGHFHLSVDTSSAITWANFSMLINQSTLTLVPNPSANLSAMVSYWYTHATSVSNLSLIACCRTKLTALRIQAFDRSSITPWRLQHCALSFSDVSINASSGFFEILSASSVEDVTIAVMSATSIFSNSFLNMYSGTGSKSMNGLALMISGSTAQFSAGGLIYLEGLSVTSNVYAEITGSSLSSAKVFIGTTLVKSAANMAVTIDSSNIFARISIIGWTSVDEISGPIVVVIRNRSQMMLANSTLPAAAFMSLSNILILDAGVSVLVEASSVTMTATWAYFSMIFFQMRNVSFGQTAGMVSLTIANSRVEIQQNFPNSTDFCALYSFIYVSASSPDMLNFVICNASLISITCASTSVIVGTQVSRMGFRLRAANYSQITLKTAVLTRHSTWTGLDTGSWLFFIVNSVIERAFVQIIDCPIICGLICQVAGLYFEYGNYYEFQLKTLNNLQSLPPTTFPLLVNSTFELRNCSILPASITSLSAEQQRPLFSFVNASNTKLVLKGPMEISTNSFDGLVGGAAAGRNLNKLALDNCDSIMIRHTSFASGGMTQQVVPLARAIAPNGRENIIVEATRTGGIGSCGLTSSFSLSSTRSPLTRHRTISPSASPSLLFPASTPARTRSLTQAAVAVATGLSAVITGPSSALSLQVLHAQLLVSGCQAAAADGGPPDVASSPTQWAIGSPESIGYDRGAVVGNVLILAACGVLACGAVTMAPVGRRAASLGLPGLLYVPYSILVVPTVTSATALLSSTPTSPQDWCISVLIGYSAALVPLLTLMAITTTSMFGARPYRVSLHPRRHSQRRFLATWFGHVTEYADLQGRQGFVEQWDYSGIMDFVAHRQWFVALEQSLGVASGFIAGLTYHGRGWCAALNAAQAIVTAAFLASLLILRPHAARADRWRALSSSFLQTGAALLGLLGKDLALVMSIIQLLVCAVYQLGYVVWQISQRRRSIWWLRTKRFTDKKNKEGFGETLRAVKLMSLDEMEDLQRMLDRANSPQSALTILVECVCRQQHVVGE